MTELAVFMASPGTGPEHSEAVVHPPKPFEGTKLYDVLAASPLVGAYGWVLLRDLPELFERFTMLAADGVEIESAIGFLGQLLALIVAGALIVSVFLRTLPLRKSLGLLPRAVALIGAAGGVTLLSLPPAQMPLWLEGLSVALILGGLSGMVLALYWLRRAFSVFPEARLLVTGGPYAFVRHPLYLFEEITFFGMMLQFAQPWAFLIFVFQCGFQLARIPYEERVLSEAFPEYAPYAARTARLVPGIY